MQQHTIPNIFVQMYQNTAQTGIASKNFWSVLTQDILNKDCTKTNLSKNCAMA